MRILLVRHGESEGNVDEKAYVEKGDHKVELTPKGWRQGIGAGQFLGAYYPQNNVQIWPETFISSYMRPKQTFSGILHGMNGAIPGQPRLKEDPRLIEKHYGAINVLRHLFQKEHNSFWGKLKNLFKRATDADFAERFERAYQKTYELDPYNTRRPLGDSSQDVMMRVKSFIDGTLQNDMDEGKDEFLIVAHGGIIKDLIMSWAHIPMGKRSQIPAAGNCDIIEISGERKATQIRRIYDGENMKPVNESILDNISTFGVDDLPPVPEQFRLDHQ